MSRSMSGLAVGLRQQCGCIRGWHGSGRFYGVEGAAWATGRAVVAALPGGLRIDGVPHRAVAARSDGTHIIEDILPYGK